MSLEKDYLDYENTMINYIPDCVINYRLSKYSNKANVSVLKISPVVGLCEDVYALKLSKGIKYIQKVLVIPKDKTISPLYRNCYYNFYSCVIGFFTFGFNKKDYKNYYHVHHYSDCFKFVDCSNEMIDDMTKINRNQLFSVDDIIELDSKYKYCGYNNNSDIYAIDYLDKFEKYPVCEMLMKLGIQRMWKDKDLQFIQDNKLFQKYLYKFQKEINTNRLSFVHVKNAFKKNFELSPEDYYNSLQYRIECGKINAGIQKDIYKKILKYTTQEKITKYLTENVIGSDSYNDYLVAADWLQLDFADTKNLFPKDFQKYHDDYVTQYAEYLSKKEDEENKHLDEQLLQIAYKYSFVESKKDSYMVIVAKSKQSLIYEGKILNHCVGKMNYDKKQINEESLICFIRKDPAIPYVTCQLEIQPTQLSIRQCYGKNNTQVLDEDFLEFREKWIKTINLKYKKLKKQNLLSSIVDAG